MTGAWKLAQTKAQLTFEEASIMDSFTDAERKTLLGYQPDSAAATRVIHGRAAIEDIGFLAAAGDIEAVSSDAAEAVAGAGGLTLVVEYLTDTFEAKEIELTMTGVTPVVSVVGDVFRVNAAYFKAWGSAATTPKANVGNIIIRPSGGGVTLESLAVGQNRSTTARYTVPQGKRAFLSDTDPSSTNNAANEVSFFVKSDKFKGTRHEALSFYPMVGQIANFDAFQGDGASEEELTEGDTIIATAQHRAASHETIVNMVLYLVDVPIPTP